MTGSFNSPVTDDLDGLSAEFGKVLHRLNGVRKSKTPNNGDGGVAQRREGLDAGRGTHATRILSIRSVPNTVQFVLDAPVGAG